MRQAVVIFPLPQLVEAYIATDCEKTIACLKVVKESLVLMRDLDIAYAYMVAYDWIKWINAPDGRDNPLSGKQKNYRRHLEVFESFAQWCEHIFDEDPNMLAQIVGQVSIELSNIESVIDCPGLTVEYNTKSVRRDRPSKPLIIDRPGLIAMAGMNSVSMRSPYELFSFVRSQSPYEPFLKDLQKEYIHLLELIGLYCDKKRLIAGLQRQRAVLQRMQMERGGELKMMRF